MIVFSIKTYFKANHGKELFKLTKVCENQLLEKIVVNKDAARSSHRYLLVKSDSDIKECYYFLHCRP